MSNDRMQGKVALVTGAASGIGAATARLLAKEGAKVLLCDVQESEGEAVAQEIREAGGAAEFFKLNVADAANWTAAVSRAVDSFGSLTTLVNGAGVVSPLPMENETEEGWDRVIGVNQKGTWLGMKAAIPALLESGNAAIVNIASMMAIMSSPGAFAYQASKAALRHMTKSVALAYATRGVRANTISPGLIETPMATAGPEEVKKMQIQATPMKRFGAPNEVANCILFLCSDDSSYVTATDIVVDGGTTAT